jgi:hypothetical protein
MAEASTTHPGPSLKLLHLNDLQGGALFSRTRQLSTAKTMGCWAHRARYAFDFSTTRRFFHGKRGAPNVRWPRIWHFLSLYSVGSKT